MSGDCPLGDDGPAGEFIKKPVADTVDKHGSGHHSSDDRRKQASSDELLRQAHPIYHIQPHNLVGHYIGRIKKRCNKSAAQNG